MHIQELIALLQAFWAFVDHDDECVLHMYRGERFDENEHGIRLWNLFARLKRYEGVLSPQYHA